MVDTKQHPFPLGEADYVEVVDKKGNRLCVLPAEAAHRQLLGHRSAMVLVFDAGGKLMLRKRPKDAPLYPDRWDLPASRHLAPGQSREEAALEALALALPGVGGHLSFMDRLSPGSGTNFEAVSVFRHVLPGRQPVQDAGRVMFVSLEELAALAQDFRELLAPTLMHALDTGLLAVAAKRPASALNPRGET